MQANDENARENIELNKKETTGHLLELIEMKTCEIHLKHALCI